MKKRAFTLLVLLSLLSRVPGYSQCFQIQSILVDACGGSLEGENEMVRFKVGAGALNVSALSVTWPSNSFLGICQNATTASHVSAINATITGCGYVKEPSGGVLPANATVILITSTAMNPTFHSFANLNDTVYMIFQCVGNVAGHFKNYQSGAGPRTLTMSFGACSDAVTYIVDSLTTSSGTHSAEDGETVEFDAAGAATYTSPGCQAPVVPLEATVTSSNYTPCPNTVINLSAVITGNYQSFFWTGGHGTFSSPNALNESYTTSASYSGVDSILLGMIGLCGDTLYDSTFITINSASLPTLTPVGPVALCPGDSVQLTVTGSGTYLWSTGATTASIYVHTSGSYSVTVTNACGTNTLNKTITAGVAQVASISAGGPTVLCPSDSLLLNASGGTTYLWSTGSTATAIYGFPGHSYILTATGTCGSDTASISLTQISVTQAVISAGGPVSFCAGDSVVLTSLNTGNYLWSTGANTQSITVKNTGTYTLTVTSQCGSSVASQAVTVNSAPTVTIIPTRPLNFCPGDSAILLANSSSGSYLWSTGASTASIAVQTAGTFTVTVTNSCGSTSASATTSVNASVSATITPSSSTTFCAGDSVTLTASGGSTYLWSNGATTAATTIHSQGLYTVTVTGSCGSSTTSMPVTVNAAPTASITPSGSLNLCPGGSVTLNGTGTGNYLWSTGATATSITTGSANSYTLTVSNSCGASSASVTVTQSSLPVATLSASSSVLCPGSPETLFASGGGTYLWSTGESSTSIQATHAGNYTVTVSNSCGNDVASISILQNPIQAAFTPDTTKGIPPLTVHFADNSIAASTWQWTFGDNANSTDTNPSHTFAAEGTFIVTLLVGDGQGCFDSETDTIVVLNEQNITVPNAFSPNGDHINDSFNAIGFGIETLNGKIFNRWGQLIYSWTDLQKGWNGTHNGNDSPEGTYYYIVEVKFQNGKHQSLKGTVTLLR